MIAKRNPGESRPRRLVPWIAAACVLVLILGVLLLSFLVDDEGDGENPDDCGTSQLQQGFCDGYDGEDD